MSSIVSARYLMTAEVYTIGTTQDDSGAIKRTWGYATPLTLNVAVEAIFSRSMSVRDVSERWGQQYVDKDWAQLSLSTDDFDAAGLSLDSRIGNIVDENGHFLFSGKFVRPGTTTKIGTVFDVLSINPVLNPFSGGVIEYQLIMAGVQAL